MSTFPLVQVEGALAMPHMRPLNRVPPPFGREWSLMPSHFSLRTELHGLYAAFLRTICLSAEAFRQVYRWDRQPRTAAEPPRPVAASVGAALSAAQAQRAAAEALGGRTAAGAQTAQRAQSTQTGLTAYPSHRLTASAVAVGGAALLAWIVASHTQFHDDKSESALLASASPASKADASPAAKSAANPATQSSTRLADERALHDRSMSGVVKGPQAVVSDAGHENGVAIGSAVVVQRDATLAPPFAPSFSPANAPAQRADKLTATPVVASAPAVAPRKETAPVPTPAATSVEATTASASAERPDFAMRTQASKLAQIKPVLKAASEKRVATANRRQETRVGARASRDVGNHHAIHEFAPHASAPLVPTRRTRGMYSEAAEYSPHQFAVNSSDEYPSLTTYAGTRTEPRPITRAPVSTDSTDWVDHVAQRRVTEVPDRFAK